LDNNKARILLSKYAKTQKNKEKKKPEAKTNKLEEWRQK
jgi:hypothetical protein